MKHELKTWPEYFERVRTFQKTFEVRKNDRDFQVGDIIILNEYLPENDKYTQRSLKAKIGYLLYGTEFGLKKGFCIMQLIDLQI